MFTHPRSIQNPDSGQIELNNQFWIFKIFLFIPFPQKTPFFSLLMFPVAHTLQYLENTVLDKNVKKNTPRMFNFRILHSKDRYTQDTSPSPKKQR